jgi:hypothetical protein
MLSLCLWYIWIASLTSFPRRRFISIHSKGYLLFTQESNHAHDQRLSEYPLLRPTTKLEAKKSSRSKAKKGFEPFKLSTLVASNQSNYSELSSISFPDIATPPAPSTAIISPSSLTVSRPFSPAELTEEAVFKKYGITGAEIVDQTRNKKSKLAPSGPPPNKPFGEDVLSKFPVSLQTKLDSALLTLTMLSLTAVVLTGLSLSFGAMKLVKPSVALPSGLEDAVTNFLAPAFGPAVCIFFFFSVTFGLFKFAQVSTSQTTYKE